MRGRYGWVAALSRSGRVDPLFPPFKGRGVSKLPGKSAQPGAWLGRGRGGVPAAPDCVFLYCIQKEVLLNNITVRGGRGGASEVEDLTPSPVVPRSRKNTRWKSAAHRKEHRPAASPLIRKKSCFVCFARVFPFLFDCCSCLYIMRAFGEAWGDAHALSGTPVCF